MRLFQWVIAFLRGEEGPTAVEYAVMLCMLLMVIFYHRHAPGTITNQTFNHPTLTSSMGDR